jgi:hypothetical protein
LPGRKGKIYYDEVPSTVGHCCSASFSGHRDIKSVRCGIPDKGAIVRFISDNQGCSWHISFNYGNEPGIKSNSPGPGNAVTDPRLELKPEIGKVNGVRVSSE